MGSIEKLIKLAKKIDPLVALGALIITGVAYAFTTFATMTYVDQKHKSVVEQLSHIQEVVEQTRDAVKTIEGRFQQLDQEGRRPGSR